MPRKPRFVFTAVPQYVIQRGHNREPFFSMHNERPDPLCLWHATLA